MLLLTACGERVEPKARQLRVGSNLWVGYEPLYVAHEMNLYPSSSVKLVELSSATQALSAFRSGLIDAAALTLDEAILLVHAGFDLRVALVFDYSSGEDVMLAKPHLGSIADLRGKTVAVEQSALGAYTLALALKKGGLTPSDIVVENGEVDVHEQLFAKDSIDAIVTFGPARARLLAAGAKLLFSSKEAPGKIIDVLVVRESIVKSHDSELRDLLDGYYAGLEKVEARDPDAMAFMAKRMGLTVAQVGESLDGVKFPNRSENNAFLAGNRPAIGETVREVADFMVIQKLLPATTSIALPSWPGE